MNLIAKATRRHASGLNVSLNLSQFRLGDCFEGESENLRQQANVRCLPAYAMLRIMTV
jgi:hypothetical protein